jgi:hypothetical protein
MWNDAHQAEFAYFRLADTDTERREILIPLILAEMERRSHERSSSESSLNMATTAVSPE